MILKAGDLWKEKITIIKVNAQEKALTIHQGKTVSNEEEDKACKTKLAHLLGLKVFEEDR